ncbi:MAG: formylglycine-generating enzyme family protein [Phormidesmis sp.]
MNQLPALPKTPNKNVIVWGSCIFLSLALIWLILLQEDVGVASAQTLQQHRHQQIKRRNFLNWLGFASISGTSIIAYRMADAWINTWNSSDRPKTQTPSSTIAPTPSQEDPVIGIEPEPSNSGSVASPPQNISSDLEESSFSFDMVRVDERGRVIIRQPKTTSVLVESLGQALTLELVTIPAGTFTMGAARGEEGQQDDRKSPIKDGPLHEVTVQSFLLGKYPVTQSLWKYVSELPRIELDLNSAPSYFEATLRPVERVSWYEAKEFCARLSKETNRQYRLPSEAEWEYACRAGTTTPFYFGESITTELSNFDGFEGSYAEVSRGIYREETTEVGLFPPNLYGLYDMHGNVWEWCADHLHETYEGAPANARAWKSSIDGSPRILRGGSWYNTPQKCRSAHRTYLSPENEGTLNSVSIGSVGFRVACSST